jgi:hypothetical protein
MLHYNQSGIKNVLSLVSSAKMFLESEPCVSDSVSFLDNIKIKFSFNDSDTTKTLNFTLCEVRKNRDITLFSHDVLSYNKEDDSAELTMKDFANDLFEISKESVSSEASQPEFKRQVTRNNDKFEDIVQIQNHIVEMADIYLNEMRNS